MAAESQTPFDVEKTLEGKNICIIGSTGFVGKVALSMFLRRYPNIGKMFVVVRPGAGYTAEERFFKKVVNSAAFDPIREFHGDGFMDFLREKVVPIPGDIARPFANFPDEQFDAFEAAGGLDVLINSAGLVSFTPSLEAAIRINTLGSKNCLDVAKRSGAALLHVSTCYVAGVRDGAIFEDEPVIGYFPRKDELRDDDFDAEAELVDCQRIIQDARDRAKDRAHISEFRERAAEVLESEGRDADDDDTMRLAVARQRKIWVHNRLTDLGRERAEHWGWTNTYTYTKSLGEQLVAMDKDVRSAIVRPAVVESALDFPSAGWNEGFNTTAPLFYMALKGHRNLVGSDNPLDVVPVDMIAASMIAVTAALIAKENKQVYQLGTSGDNPVSSRRLGELIGLAVRGYYRDKAKAGESPLINHTRARLETVVVTYDQFNRRSAPQIKRVSDGLINAIDKWLPKWGAPRLTAMAERAKDELAKVSEFTGRAVDLIEMFRPFTETLNIVYKTENMNALFARMTPEDQAKLPWAPKDINWRTYWLETHFTGLQKWVFPVLDDEFGPTPRSVYTYKELLELFDATCKLHRHRVAMRLLRSADDEEPDVYTYQKIHDMAQQFAGGLRQRGVVADDRVMLMGENRPEWGISYFGILKAGAVAVPVDSQLSVAEVANLLRASGSKVLALSAECARDLADMDDDGPDDYCDPKVLEAVKGELADAGVTGVIVEQLSDLLDEPAVSPGALGPKRRGSDVASIIYTSGTTGEPKGVMLTHKNLTAMVAKLSSIFRLYKHDRLLSVLPMHHTFEFTVGLLMPLMRGSEISYMDELTPEALNDALAEGKITGMVGVPALWQALHRKIHKPFSDRGVVAERAFETLVDLNRSIRDKAPYGLNLGRFLFFPVHGKLGGRIRLLISGGSALPEEVNKTFQGLGFRLFEGYGMTESSPVLTVQRPGEKTPISSVGRPLPGVDVRIFEPDANGVGEVIATGPNIMLGYYENEDATAQVLREGWLHTGDLGRIDEDGNVYIVGRKKEMILGSSGENVYPDELEELYRDSAFVKELSIVGLPSPGAGETVACLVVPDYEAEGTRGEIRDKVREHFKEVSVKLPLYKRVKVLHLWDHDLPKTSTRKVKRREVLAELGRLERAANSANASADASEASGEPASWVKDVIAEVCQKPRKSVTSNARLEDLGFDSLMYTEFGVALESAGLELPDPSELNDLETVGDVEAFVAARPRVDRKRKNGKSNGVAVLDDNDDIDVPEPVARAGRRALRMGQRALYERVFHTKVTGKSFVPPFGGYIVVANHSSHLDMGLVKHALAEQGDLLVALAAKDYFFEDPVRKAYFENFTNLVPMERHGSLRESLRLASDVVRDGHVLLIFPEGTRSESGVMIDFKASLGFLAMNNKCGILPMYLAGCHDAFPKGAYWPKQRDIAAHIGPFMDYPQVAALAEGKSRSEGYRSIATHFERVVRGLAPSEFEWTLGAAGRNAVADLEEQP